MRAVTDMRAPIFYDYDNTAYFVDPNSTSRIVRLALNDGDNLSWGGVYGAGVPTIAATTNTALYFYPTGSTAGATFTMFGSYAIATGSMRAPIFYDSDNTAYYVDPAGSSVLGIITAQSTNDAQLYLNGNGTSWAGIQWTDVSASDNMWYNGSTSTFAIGGGGSAVANKKLHINGATSIGSSLALTAVATNGLLVETQVSAPIYYDSDNTAYYVDPASTSVLNNVLTVGAVSNNVGGLRNVNPGGGSYVTSTPTVSGAIKIKLPETSYPMLRFTVRVYTYDGLSFDIYCGGHTSSALWYNTFAYMTTQNRPALNVRFTGDGTNMYVIIGELAQTWTYPQVFITDVQVGYTNYEASRWDDGWVISFETSTYHTVGSTHQVFPPTSSTNNVNPAYASIYYDSGNTAYYVDPASSGASVNIAGSVIMTTSGGERQVKFAFTGRDAYLYGRDSDDVVGLYDTVGGSRWTTDTSNNFVAFGSSRAPIFYDSGNTAYYLDPAGTTALNINGQIQFAPNTAQISGNDTSSYGSIAIRGARSGWYGIHIQGGGNVPHLMFTGGNGGIYFEGTGRWASYYSHGDNCWGFGTTATSSAYNIYCPTGVYSGGRVDGTIFYDSNDTAYYWNFASGATSNIYTLITGLAFYKCVFGSGVYSSAVNSPPLQVYSEDGGTAMFSFHRAGAYAVNFGLDPDNVLRIGGWSAAANRLQLDGSGNLTMAGNVTAYSDARLKKDVETIGDALGLVGKMRGVTYTRIDTDKAGVGVIAQEMLEVLPQVVQQGIGDDDTLSVAYGNLVGVLIEAIKELTARVAELEGK